MKKFVAIVLVFSAMISFAACSKKEVVGYDPVMPQEWVDAIEEQKNSLTTEAVRTNDFSGIWQNDATGEYFHVFEGGIYKVARPDATEEEVEVWGGATLVQVINKEDEMKYMYDKNPLVPGEELQVYYDCYGEGEVVEKLVVLEEDRTKVITESGREITFKRVQEVTDGPAGHEAATEFEY